MIRNYMEYISQSDDDVITTLRVPKRVRRKLGMLITGNENLDVGLERILDEKIIKI